jgi:ADP-ribose pyrophosphatase
LELSGKKTILETHPFSVEELSLTRDGQPITHPYYRLHCADWVNVLPVTTDRKAILVRQPRAGSMKRVLETPGGMIDPHEKDPTMAALRELEEETGFTSQRILPLAVINPNPAIMTNRCHYFLALNCYVNPTRTHFPDAEERIELEVHDFATLDQMIRSGEIDHSLSALCIMLAGKYLPAP